MYIFTCLRFKDHISGVAKLPADLRSMCYTGAVQNADISVFEEMLKLYRETDLNEEQYRISEALGCFKQVDILTKVINFAMSVRNTFMCYALHLY